MKRIMTALAVAAMLATSPALAGGSVEQPDDKKAPESNKTGTDAPANPAQGESQPSGQGAPVPKDAAKGSSGTSSDATQTEQK